jgi:SAM-dependent methyltransferase
MCPVCQTASVVEDEALSSCPVCKHIWQTGLKGTAVYDAQYVRSRYDVYSTTEAMSYLRLGFVKAFARNGRILDVGYGNGSFLKKAAKAGFSAFGSDVHGTDYGVHDIPLDEAAMGSWDVVTFFDSLEHFSDLSLPREVALRARVVIASIPCRPDEFPACKEWRHYRPGEHLHYFSRYSLELFFVSHHVVASRSDVEDTIRGKLPSGEQNILTMAFITT